ncbi:hypothetical protein ACROYT_G007238 [Oculina patagonica]
MDLAKRNAIEHLNGTADHLDKVWRDCRISSVTGNSAGILGVKTASKALAGATEGGTAGVKAGAGTIGKAGASAGAKAAGGAIIGVSAVFLVWDAVDLGFNIRDLVEDKGSAKQRVV